MDEIFTKFDVNKFVSFKLVSPYVAVFNIKSDFVNLHVDIRNGKIQKISAIEGYEGSFNNIRTGMTFMDAVKIDDRIYYDEIEYCAFVNGVDGISFGFAEIDPDPQTIQSLKINEIFVFAIESLTLSGQEGD